MKQDNNYIEMMRLIGDLRPGGQVTYYTGDSLSKLSVGSIENERSHEKFTQWCRMMSDMTNVSYFQRKLENGHFEYIACRPTKKLRK